MKSGKNTANPVGSVLVVGGGVGGIQASLDLAESGFFVYLVEASPAIGGVMAQLDKTFPTNDCSMCILSPKLVDTGRHQNIRIFTQTTIERVEGEVGDFKVVVKKAPRYIIEDKCTGCAECAQVCPVERLSAYDEGLVQRKAIYRPYAQAIPNIFTISKNERPPCTTTCPINTNAQGYIALIRQRKFKEALELVREKNPLPSICGRVCTHPCETECNRRDVDEPIAIATLKRFAADYELTHGREEIKPASRTKEEKVAIIGSGPAGLTCAHDLVKLGYGVTIFEALPKAGGMLAVGIPNYRLPKDILAIEVGAILRLGVEIKRNTPIGKDLTIDDLFSQRYKAIFIAIGAHKSRRLNIPGEDAGGVVHGTEFLRELNLGREVKVEKKVAIIGGGNVAIDAARSALRLGSKEVFILYRRSREEMPASDEEIEAAKEEGIKIQYLAAPVEVLARDGKVAGLKCIRMELGEPDTSGRRRPIPIEGSEFTIEAEMIIPAIGQAPDTSFLPQGEFKLGRGGTFEADPISLATNMSGVFAGGDAVSGPATVIEAMAAGRRASNSIDRYLRGQDLKAGRESEFMTTTHAELDIDITEVEKKPRQELPTISKARRMSSFDEVNLGFSEDMAVREAERCLDCGICSECLECVKACKAEAIDHSQKGEIINLNVGSIILSPGFDEFDATIKGEYGYGIFPNVITSIQFERILSASGPYQGKVLRPSDNTHPINIAFIQCVGSRDLSRGRSYCSSVCCMYATKEAVIAKEHATDLNPTIFYMDMRSYGKDFDRYIERAEIEYGVRFIRSRVSAIEQYPDTKNLLIKYESEDGRLLTEEFELVVLSVGLDPPREVVELAKKLGIELNEHNFAKSNPLDPLGTSRPGVFVCGVFSEPKDIPETVTQASGAASCAGSLLSPARGTLVVAREFPPEIDVAGQEPRIGVFICHCGINIGGYVDVPQVVEYARILPDVVYAEDNLYTCSQDTQEKIKLMIKEHNLNRVVVASCTPRTHEPLFQQTIREAGLNKYLFEMANIRDQCSWVHMREPDRATKKAMDLVRMAVAKATLIEPLERLKLDLTSRAMVIGGGISGMTASLSLAEQGFDVFLIEKEAKLGGMANRIYYTLEGEDVQAKVREMIGKVTRTDKIKVYLNTNIKEIAGFIGNFRTIVETVTSDQIELKHGVIIVATGCQEYKPREYLYGQDPKVITQLELEERLANNQFPITNHQTIVMVQCVGSRDDNRPYCSRVCCAQAIKNALKIKEANPHANIFILYRDIRTYGFKEEYYKKARDLGVIFIRYDQGNKPKIIEAEGERLRLQVFDPIIDEELLIDTDLLILSVAIIPRPDIKGLAQMLKVTLNEDNFFLEAHVKLRPVDFATEGIFLCGLAHSPKFIDESISQAYAAASRATTVLSKEYIETEGVVSTIDRELCSGCKLCIGACPYDAISYNEQANIAEVNDALCKGCGNCAVVCPSKACSVKGFNDEQIFAQIEALL